jgi:hypothetical protein
MPGALWLLLWLNFRAFLRRTGRQARSVRGILFFLVGIGVLSIWILPSIFLNGKVPPVDPRETLSTAPVAILLLCVLNLFTSAGERAVTFTAAEVDFLFPGPFSRRSILIYKLIKTALGTIISALIFAVVLRRYGGFYPYRFAGIWLIFQFTQLLSMTLALVQTIAGERIFAAGRWWIAIVLAIVAGLALTEVFQVHHQLSFKLLAETRDTRAGRLVLKQFAVFAQVLVARRFSEFISWAGAAAAIDLVMAVIVVGLDANYLETSATISARRYARLSRIRRSGVSGSAKPASARWKIPMLPWAAGMGPIVWRQLTTAIRTARNLLIVLAVIAIVVGVAISHDSNHRSSIGFLVGLAVWLNVFFSRMLSFDFRGDVDHMDLLRSLPLRPTAIAAAQLVAPSLIMTIIVFLLLATIAVVGHYPSWLLVAMAVFVLPVNLLSIGTDNLMFLLFPFRPTAAVAGDMGLIGRQAIVFACRAIMILLVLGLSAGVGAGAWYMTNESVIAAAAGAWIPLAGCIALLVWLMGMAFNRFDPSVNTPT